MSFSSIVTVDYVKSLLQSPAPVPFLYSSLTTTEVQIPKSAEKDDKSLLLQSYLNKYDPKEHDAIIKQKNFKESEEGVNVMHRTRLLIEHYLLTPGREKDLEYCVHGLTSTQSNQIKGLYNTKTLDAPQTGYWRDLCESLQIFVENRCYQNVS